MVCSWPGMQNYRSTLVVVEKHRRRQEHDSQLVGREWSITILVSPVNTLSYHHRVRLLVLSASASAMPGRGGTSSFGEKQQYYLVKIFFSHV